MLTMLYLPSCFAFSSSFFSARATAEAEQKKKTAATTAATTTTTPRGSPGRAAAAAEEEEEEAEAEAKAKAAIVDAAAAVVLPVLWVTEPPAPDDIIDSTKKGSMLYIRSPFCMSGERLLFGFVRADGGGRGRERVER